MRPEYSTQVGSKSKLLKKYLKSEFHSGLKKFAPSKLNSKETIYKMELKPMNLFNKDCCFLPLYTLSFPSLLLANSTLIQILYKLIIVKNEEIELYSWKITLYT